VKLPPATSSIREGLKPINLLSSNSLDAEEVIFDVNDADSFSENPDKFRTIESTVCPQLVETVGRRFLSALSLKALIASWNNAHLQTWAL
jgi:hypothetical protein